MGRIRKLFKWTFLTIAAVLLVGGGVGGVVLSHDTPCGDAQAAPGGDTMKAAVRRCYGGGDVVRVETVAKPKLDDDQVLVKVRAASVNPLDWHYLHGSPYLMRMDTGIGAPKEPRFGVDFAGTVEAVGSKVTHFKPGDDVFGARNGAFGEYVVVREDKNIVSKPANVSFAEAASVPIAALTALQALRDKGHLQPGQKVLVNGASGGVGTFAVQIAKALGGEVTAVCSTRNLEMVRGIGADHVIDYTKEDVTRRPEQYDLIIDTVMTHGLFEYKRILKPDGRFVIVGGVDKGDWIGPMSAPIKAFVLRPFLGPNFRFMLAELSPKDLAYLAGLMESGKVKPVLDRTYPLAQTGDALAYVEAGHARGKVVIDMEQGAVAQQ